MPKKTIWTEQTLREVARLYLTRAEFRKARGGAYATAERDRLLDDICAHMPRLRRHWTFDDVKTIAAGYNRKATFRFEQMAAYTAALRAGWLPAVTAHMDTATTGQGHHLVYAYDFPFGLRYIGLTCVPEMRARYHTTRGTVADFLLETGVELPEMRILHRDLDAGNAARLEQEEIAKALAAGVQLLNRHSGGGTGAWARYSLSKEQVLQIARPYSTRQEFRQGAPGARARAKAMGWFDEATAHMSILRRTMSEKELAEVARRFPTRGEFQKLAPNAYQQAFRRGLIDVVCAHMPSPRNKSAG